MSERCGWTFFLTLACAIAAALIFYLSPTPVYETKQSYGAYTTVSYTQMGRVIADTLPEQYKSGTLPDITLKEYMDALAKSNTVTVPATTYQEVVGQSAPHQSWMVVAGGSGFFLILFCTYAFFDSRWYQSVVNYWKVKTELQRTLNAKKLKTLEDLIRIQEKMAE